jgi:pilus assembly protein CpaC
MKKALKIAVLLIFLVSGGYGYSLGEEAIKEEAPKKEEKLMLYKGEIKILDSDNPTRIIIGNPEIADVKSVSKNEMFIIGNGAGSTNLIWWDTKGVHSFQVDVYPESMPQIKERVDNVLREVNVPGVFTRTLDKEGKLLLLGYVKTTVDIERINAALGSLKEKTVNLIQIKEEETVIGIDVQVLELSKDATSTLGLTWPNTMSLTEVNSPGLTGTSGNDLFRIVDIRRSAFALTLDALAQEGKARILSQPNLFCQSGKEAELLVGGEKPILTTNVVGSTGASGTSVDYKQFGITLKIRPTVTDDNKIKLALKVTVSETGQAEVLGSSNSPTAKAYPLSTRSAATELFLNDGQTMSIGGLKKQKTEESIVKVPLFGDLPLLGRLFQKKSTSNGGGFGEKGDIELYIVLTPTIVKNRPQKEEVKSTEASSIKEEKPGNKEPSKAQSPPAKNKEAAKKEAAKPVKAKQPDSKKSSKSQVATSTKNTTVPPGSKPRIVSSEGKVRPVSSEYISKVMQQIRQNFVYPKAVKEANLGGALKLRLRISSSGQLQNVEIKESSGQVVLDENAVNIVKKVAPYPPFPSEMSQKELWIDLPIVYKANQ